MFGYFPFNYFFLKYRLSKKKTGIANNMAITTLKSIRKGKTWCVLENSAQMLQDMDQTFQNWWKNGLEK